MHLVKSVHRSASKYCDRNTACVLWSCVAANAGGHALLVVGCFLLPKLPAAVIITAYSTSLP